jgi:hypothetical protein
VLTADDQLGLFADYKQRVSKAIGAAMAEELLGSALYSLTFGGNDYINNYLRLFSSSSMEYSLPQYQQLLLSAYKAQLTVSYCTKLSVLLAIASSLAPPPARNPKP